MRPTISNDGSKSRQNGRRNGKRITLRSPRMRELARRLARLGTRRVRKGEALNVRRREAVRRAFIEAGETLGWAAVAAHSPDAVDVAAKDVERILRRGVRSLKRRMTEDLEAKEAEARRLEELVQQVHRLAEDPTIEYPTEITYVRTAKSPVQGLITKTETVTLEDPEAALRMARKIEKSLPGWARLREQMLDDMRKRRRSLRRASRNLSDLVESWRDLLSEVLVTMP